MAQDILDQEEKPKDPESVKVKIDLDGWFIEWLVEADIHVDGEGNVELQYTLYPEMYARIGRDGMHRHDYNSLAHGISLT